MLKWFGFNTSSFAHITHTKINGFEVKSDLNIIQHIGEAALCALPVVQEMPTKHAAFTNMASTSCGKGQLITCIEDSLSDSWSTIS